MASTQGASLGRMYPVWSKQRGFMSFLAVRPILTGEMITAKYRMAGAEAGRDRRGPDGRRFARAFGRGIGRKPRRQ